MTTCRMRSVRSNKPIIVMPKDFHPNDYTTYETGSRSPRELYSLLVDQFDYLYEEGLDQPEGDERDAASVPRRPRLSR